MAWKARLFMGLMLSLMLLAIAGPAMADDDCDFRERGNRDDVVVCRDDGDREVFEVEDFDYYLDDDFFEVEEEFFFDPFLFFVAPFFVEEEFFFVSDCPFAGDFEGPVNQFDCFD